MMRPLSVSANLLTIGCLGIAAGAAIAQVSTPTSAIRAQSIAPKIAQAAPTTAALEQAVFKQINAYRVSQNLPPLVLDNRISEQARLHSQNMANKSVPFGHQGFQQRAQVIGRSIPYSSIAENVAYNMGYKDPATQAVQGWLKRVFEKSVKQ